MEGVEAVPTDPKKWTECSRIPSRDATVGYAAARLVLYVVAEFPGVRSLLLLLQAQTSVLILCPCN